MKTLILLRHAEAVRGIPDDHARELTPHGDAQARQSGDWLRQNGYTPDCTLCSTAMRTRQTLALAMETAGFEAPGEALDALYNHNPADYLRTIRKEGQGDTLLLVGHNPDICQLAASLADGGNEAALTSLLQMNFPTGAVAVLTADIADWADLRLRGATLAASFIPA